MQLLAISDIACDRPYAVVGGPFGSKLGRKDYVAEGVPVLRGGNLSADRRIDLSNLVFVSDEKVNRDLSSNLAHPGDIIVTQRGTLGRVGFIPLDVGFDRFVVSQSQMKLTVDSDVADPRFVYYYLKSPAVAQRLIGYASSSGVPHINLEIFRRFQVQLPALEIQCRVADTLTLFDDLIENNRRRIEILEQVALLLYQEYFVHFRLPYNENTEFIDSELGSIPQGWKVCRTDEVIESVGGGTPSRKIDEYWLNGSVQWYTPSDLTRSMSSFAFNSADKITELGLKKSSAKLFPAGSVMLTSRATIGEVSIAVSEASTNQGFITCIPSENLTTNYLYFWLLDNVPVFEKLAGGATFKELRKSTFRELSILVPDERTMARFQEEVDPVMTLVKNLLQQNNVLRELHDFLLPRLVSGKLDISDLDTELEAAAV